MSCTAPTFNLLDKVWVEPGRVRVSGKVVESVNSGQFYGFN